MHVKGSPIRYPTRSKISSELSNANLIDTNNQNTTLVKISIVTAGCHAEKSVLMLFDKRQKVLISIDTTENDDSSKESEYKPTKISNGVELNIDDNVVSEDDLTKLEIEQEPQKSTTQKAITTTTAKGLVIN